MLWPKNSALLTLSLHFAVKNENLGKNHQEYMNEFGEEKWKKLQQMNKFQKDQWKKAWGFPDALPECDTIEETCQLWLDDLDAKGVEKAVFVTAGGLEQSNENMARIVQFAPDRFIGYAHQDPFAPDAAQKVGICHLPAGVAPGIKILGPALDRPLDDKSLYPLWQVAEKHQVPVLFHFGIMGAAGGIMDHINISPKIIQNVAKAFPDVIFIVPHYGCSKVEDTLFLCWVCPNVYIDTSNGSNQWTRWMPYPLTTKDLFKKYSMRPSARTVFCLAQMDPGSRGASSVNTWMYRWRDCVELGFSGEDIQKIFAGNIERVLGRYIK